MYTNFFGFTEKPFDVTPDPRFLYLSPEHRETLATLMYGIQERRGFIVIVGEVGTGKTTLLNTVLDRLDERTKVASSLWGRWAPARPRCSTRCWIGSMNARKSRISLTVT
jgi:general secretion pathway protein A